ncbi:MAG: LysM peptidoglycan-binding domain-containing protein [Chloroflexi bacterium]|nr:LysM peptidoglycan-binding domain-containing protein [Chloroflexota bacterium]
MKRTRTPLFLSAIGLLIVLGLVTGCYRAAAPDVTETPAGEAEVAPPQEGTPDVLATAAANSALATQQAETGGGSPIETPTTPAPTQTQSPVATPATTPTPTPTTSAPTTPVPTQTPLPPTGQVTHVVQPGENLFRIAMRYNTTVNAIASANGIANPALIYVGQKLTIPSSGTQPPSPPSGGTTYVVQPGDNLFRIALRYNMSYTYLAQYNGITNPANIYVGQVIRIP